MRSIQRELKKKHSIVLFRDQAGGYTSEGYIEAK